MNPPAMYLPVLLTALAGLVLAAPALRFVRTRAKRGRARIQYRTEYYLGWSGCRHPIKLEHRITKEQAKALAATGGAYLIGHFGDKGRLRRAVKLERGVFVSEYLYSYHPNGRLQRVRVTRGRRVTVLEYDQRGHSTSDAGIAF
jgi:hypothetical protein